MGELWMHLDGSYVRKATALLLSIMLLVNLVPMTVLADIRSTINNTTEQNQAILDALRQLYGEELTSEAARQELGDLGLLDDNGELVVTATVDVDGEQLALDQVRQMVFSADADLDKLVSVDGTPITLGDLKLMIEIEDELLRIKDTYFGDVTLTPEQQAALDSLRQQIESEGITVAGLESAAPAFPSGVDHGIFAEITPRLEVANGTGDQSLTVTLKDSTGATLTAVPNYDIRLAYRFVDGDAKSTVNYTGAAGILTFAANSAETSQDILFNIGYDSGAWAGQKTFLVQYYSPENVLLQGGMRAAETVVLVNSTYSWKVAGNLCHINGQWSNFADHHELYTDAYKIYQSDSYREKLFSAVRLDLRLYSTNAAGKTITPVVYFGDPWDPYCQSVSVAFPSFTWEAGVNEMEYSGLANYSYNPDMVHGMVSSIYGHPLAIQLQGATGVSGSFLVDLGFIDRVAPQVLSVSMPQGTVFEYGQSVPITVEYSEPMMLQSAELTVNGEKLSPVGTSSAMRSATFLYPVKRVDGTELNVLNVSGGYDRQGGNAPVYSLGTQTATGIMQGVNKADAFTTAFATAVIDQGSMRGTVTLNLADPVPEWLTAEAGANSYLVPSIYASVDGGASKIDLYADSDYLTALVGTFTPDFNLSGVALNRVVEFYLDPELNSATNHQLLVGPHAVYTVPPAVFLAPEDLGITYPAFPAEGIVFAEDDTPLRLDYVVDNPAATWQRPGDFAWSSSDETIATISSGGVISLTGTPGSVSFTLTAHNGGYDGYAVSVISSQLTARVGLTPFLKIPGGTNVIPVKQGASAEVRWASNLIAKNAEVDAETEFTIEVFAADYSTDELQMGELVYTAVAVGNPTNALSSVTIPAEYLGNVSVIGRYSYVVRVSSPDPVSGETLSATAHIVVLSQPAVVKLAQLPSYYITDQSTSIPLSWALEHFDTINGGEFALRVVNNANNTAVVELADTGDQGGSTALSIPIVENGFKDIYTVTVKARNAADSTWSYDSCVLYVYSSSALQVLIDGVTAGTNHTMSNIERISSMTSAEILALQRDISLRNVISINYGEHAWGQISDQIKWQSTDSSVATINYRQGSLHENIENFSYVSYRPATEFILSGLQDGTTRVTATHAATGEQRTVDVQVKTLRDKLYLFQFYPRAVTTLTYANGLGQQCSVQTNGDGALALFEESGIQSDIYLQATHNERDYRGTIYNERLVSAEKDSTKLELYPENNFKLREVATAELYFKQPNGEPFVGDVILRGGVYKNGKYCPEALLNGLDGATDQTVTLDVDGKLTVKMDMSQFWTDSDQEVLQPADRLQFIYEVRFPDPAEPGCDLYYPQLLNVSGNLNAYEIVQFGAGTLNLRSVRAGDQYKPFVESQTADYIAQHMPFDIHNYTGKLGPSGNLSQLTITSRVLWWGEATDAGLGLHQVSYQDQFGTTPGGQTSETAYYPFSSIRATSHTFVLNREVLDPWLETAESRAMQLLLTDGNGNQYKKLDMPFRIANMLDAEKAKDSDSLIFVLEALGVSSTANAGQMSLSDQLINKGLSFLAGRGIDSQVFSMVIRPTVDPTVFKAMIMVNVGNMSDDNVTGVYSDNNLNSDLDYTPSAMAAQQMVKGQYLQKQRELYKHNKENARSRRARDISYSIGGYMEAEISYNEEEGKWQILILNGGFNAGGGVSYSWNYNAWVGPVPVTAQLAVGGTLEIIFKAAVQRGEYIEATYNQDAVNDYLTTLRLYAYVRAFGGLGQDYTVAALKIGLFGQVSVDAQFAFLNQPYISSTATKGQKLSITGKVGIEFVAKFLFTSYEKILASQSFNIYQQTYGSWNAIQALWAQIGSGSSDRSLSGFAVSSAGDALLYPLAERAVLEQRDYLEQFERTWVTSGRFSLLALDPVNGVKDLQTNAYPYSNPVLSDDGQLMVYISDSNSSDVEDTEVCWTRLSGSSYPNGTPLDPGGTGYGESQLKLAGDARFAAAVWVRQTAGLDKEAGSAITYSDVALMSNSTEIMVGLYNGSEWTTTRLTSNASPDLAPVVATNGQRVLVAWRSVYPADASDPLNFSTQDCILYRVYEDGVWSSTYTLYNGTSGAVKGMEAAMLADGTAAVTYTIDTLNSEFAVSDGESINSGLEAVYAIVGIDGQVLRNVRLTNDRYLDENPQITTVDFADGREWFVLGWYSVHDADGIRINDIRLVAFDHAGTLHTDFIDSISGVNEYANVYISPNFRFAKNASSITDLAIIWSEPADSGAVTDSSTLADKDLLRAVKFMSDNGRIFITSALDVAEMPDFTLVNHFDAYVTADSVKVVILGTSYDNGYEPTGMLIESAGEAVPLLTATPQSGLYTAACTFENAVEVRSLGVDYQAVVRGMRIPVQFTLFNAGIEPITGITLQVGENEQEFSSLYLLPNGSITLTVYYDIPGDRVINPDYSITASFGEDASLVTLTDKLYLAIPDVGISKLENLQEQDGERLLQVTLYNLSDVQLCGSSRIVKIGLYSDADMTAEVMAPLTISSAADLALIDAGAFTRQVTFDIQEHLGIGQEIPAGGVRIYTRAWIEEPLPDLPGETGEIMEYYQGNNARSILFESLLLRNDGAPATISTEQTNAGGYTTAVVTVKNNSLVNVSSGNLVARLLDSRGNELETLQSYDREAVNQGLIELGPEGVAVREFRFSQQGEKVTVTYSNAIITDNTNANLATLTLSEIPFKFVAGVTEYTVNVQKMTGTTVSAVTEDPSAAVQVNGRDGGLTNVRLAAGRNTVQIAVTAADGVTVQKYMVTVYNYVPGSEPVIWPTVIQNPGGRVAYSGGGLVTVTPDQGYCVKDLLINGKSVGAVTSYIIPAGTEAYRIEALFGPATGLITIKQNNGGTVTVGEDGLSITIAPDEGYRIQDVLVDGGSVGAVSSYAFEPPATAHELEVLFAPIVGTVTVSHNAGGTVRVSEDGLRVTIIPGQGYRIKDVLVDGRPVGIVVSYLFTTPGQAHTVQVVFEPVGNILTGFTDVANHWARGAIAFAVERGLLVGTSASNFSPNTPITRAMLVTVLMRLHGGRPETQARFSDVTAGAWYAGSIAWAVENGIAGSVGNNAFAPNRPATREELAQIVINYCRFAGIELPQAEVIAFSDISSVSPDSRAAVTDMQQAGLMGGRPGNLFDPQGNLTRAEFAAVLQRLITNTLSH